MLVFYFEYSELAFLQYSKLINKFTIYFPVEINGLIAPAICAIGIL